jgi:hypothetical protein
MVLQYRFCASVATALSLSVMGTNGPRVFQHPDSITSHASCGTNLCRANQGTRGGIEGHVPYFVGFLPTFRSRSVRPVTASRDSGTPP